MENFFWNGEFFFYFFERRRELKFWSLCSELVCPSLRMKDLKGQKRWRGGTWVRNSGLGFWVSKGTLYPERSRGDFGGSCGPRASRVSCPHREPRCPPPQAMLSPLFASPAACRDTCEPLALGR